MPAWWPMSGLDLIPDAETALKVGKIILEKYYGDGLVRRYEPYRATLNPHDATEWLVSGNHPDPSFVGFGDGFPYLSISRRDCHSDD